MTSTVGFRWEVGCEERRGGSGGRGVEVKEVGKVEMLDVVEWTGTVHRAEGLECVDWKVGTWSGSRG